MSVPFGQAAFTVGELSPTLFGRFDTARFHLAAGTMRNFFTRYQGGASSRAGTAFVGFSKQTGRNFPPRLIPFEFSVTQGLMLEFGHHYMRIISHGAFVTETPVAITDITQANGAVVTHAGTSGGQSAVADNTGVINSYNGGDQITIAGGTYLTPAVIEVDSTLVLDVQLGDPGGGVYDIGDTIDLAGGTQLTTPVVTVASTQVTAATIANPGAGGTPGSATVTGTTGTGTMFQATVTISGGGVISSVDAITVPGDYTVNPTVTTAEPVTGGGLAGAELNVEMGVLTFTLTDAGELTANPVNNEFTQGATSGTGTGATFGSALFGVNDNHFSTAGSYTSFPPNPVLQASTTGVGVGVEFAVTTGTASAFANGDWVQIAQVNGMTQVNNRTFVIGNVTATTFLLYDVYGNVIDSTLYSPYTGGGTISRIYTVTSPYAEEDIEWLKYTQSADVMSFGCVNQDTLTEYPPYDLSRLGATDWVFEEMSPASTISYPSGVTATASSGGTTNYNYRVTSINPEDGSESAGSQDIGNCSGVDIATTPGSITVAWNAVPTVQFYNVYKATPGYNNVPVPVGAQFGFAGQVQGLRFIDSNVFPDFSQVPPIKTNPFARGVITDFTIVQQGAGYTTAGFTITTATGSGFVAQLAVINGAVAYAKIFSAGQGYLPTDTVTITGDGAGATAVLTVGALTGTYPSAVGYFQQRRVYGDTLNRPDTYFMSQPGSYTNFDSRNIPLDTDAIIGNPWAVQVDGIQFFVDMPGGLLAFCGANIWQLTGAGGSSFNPQPITPESQSVQPQAANGCNPKMPPIKIEYDVVYAQTHGSIVRNLGYSYQTNIYAGSDLTLNSSHLFTAFQLREWAWCEEPYKLVWAVRDDGVLLSMTFVKSQEIVSWCRHDTNGLFRSVASVTELPVDAPYFAVERTIGVNQAYTIERMDNRIWTTVEDNWCVDCAAALPRSFPDATLRASSAKGLGAVTGATIVSGGSGWSAGTTATVVDDNGNGSGTGAVPTLTIVGGVITAVTFLLGQEGSGYSYPALVITDPAGSDGGSGAVVRLTLDNTMTFTASAPVFSLASVGEIIRMGGGVAEVTGFTSSTVVQADMISPIIKLVPGSGGRPQPAKSGDWSIRAPVTTITGLEYLVGATVTGLYDGHVLPPTVVPESGRIELPAPATAVVIGLGFQAQLQSIMVDPQGGSTAQGQRKALPEVVARIQNSRGLKVGTNQVDGSTLSPPQAEVEWINMKDLPDRGRPAYNSTTEPLWTGDQNASTMGGWDTRGQVAIQQDNPIEANVLAFVPNILEGDTPEKEATKQGRGMVSL